MTLTRRFLDELSTAQLLERLDLALEGANLGIWDWDLRDNSVQFDRRWCEMLGLDHATTPMVLDTWSARAHPDDLDGCYRDIRAHLDGHSPRYQNVHRMRHADGRWLYILDRGRIAGRDEQGRPIRFTGTHLDITAITLAEERTRREEQARLTVLMNFSATLAHELNTPLQVIALAAHALTRLGATDDGEGNGTASREVVSREAVDAIVAMSDRAGRITSALRALSQRDGLAESPFSHSFAQAIELFHDRFDSEGISVSIVDESNGAVVRATAGDVLRAHVFLLDGALRALLATKDAKRSVHLAAQLEGAHVIVTCTDSGVRWAPEGGHDEIEPSSLSPSELLGPIVARFGGGIEVSDRSHGNHFTVRFPLVTASV
ncbi:PAS domain-containing protein [Gemmatimonas phototrophica]|nr:PAS domain-containing protein [Gemmatimonas phototrophica]